MNVYNTPMPWLTITCPYCAATIPLSADRCPRCRSIIPHEAGDRVRNRFFASLIALFFLLVLLVLGGCGWLFYNWFTG
ncbi:MAG: hypothetical protein GC154_06470 [bacterium]|nr:hypothetical protein [bacterium]